MFNHHDIWQAIDTLAEQKGLSTSGLAKQAGLDPTTFNKSKRTTAEGKLRWPSTESLSKILLVTNTPLHEFLSYLSGEEMESHYAHLPYLTDEKAGDGMLDVFLTQQASGQPSAIFDKISVLPPQKDKLLAFELTRASLKPLYKKNTILILDFSGDYRRHDRILVKPTQQNGDFICGPLIRETTGKIWLNDSLHDDMEVEMNKDDILWYAHILWASQ